MPGQKFIGVVQKGLGSARRLGFPTVNIPLADESVSGIYAARVTIKKADAPYQAAAYADQKRGLLEAYLLDFNDDLTGVRITIELAEKLRESALFADELALHAAIAEDVRNVRRFFASREKPAEGN